MLFAVTSFLGVPLAFVLSALAGRVPHQSGIAAALGLFGIAGYAGLWISPAAAPWLWAVLLGVVNSAFPLVLTMIALRGRTPATVVRLSAFAQGVGYLIAIPGPILVGVLHDRRRLAAAARPDDRADGPAADRRLRRRPRPAG